MSANQISFTAPKIERLKCEPDKLQSFYWDNKTPTLGIRVTANGAKSYIFQSWFVQDLHPCTCQTQLALVFHCLPR